MTGEHRNSLINQGVLQGCLLSCSAKNLSPTAKAAIKQGRAIASTRGKEVQDDQLLLVLSQDCDIENPTEHHVEVLPIKKLKDKKVSAEQQRNRNYRKLQLPINGDFWLLEADLISLVPKCVLEENSLVVEDKLHDRNLEIVVDWRVGRYNRRPFPHKFNLDFLGAYVKSPEYSLGAYLEENRDNIIDLFVYVSPSDEEEAAEYIVSITALLDESCSHEDEASIREELLKHWEELHRKENSLRMAQIDESYAPDDASIPRELVMRESEFTFYDARQMKRINLDYLCYPD